MARKKDSQTQPQRENVNEVSVFELWGGKAKPEVNLGGRT